MLLFVLLLFAGIADIEFSEVAVAVVAVVAAAALNLSDFKLEDSETSRSLENETSFSFQQK